MSKLDLIHMSAKEVSRLKIIEKVIGKEITQAEGSAQLKVSVRQVRRLIRRYQKEGVAGLCSKKRGLPSNNKIGTDERERVSLIIKEYYPDFGPTLAHEKLKANHQVRLSVETVRDIMIKTCDWQPKSRKKKPVYQSRKRRSRFGELIQIDGSPHAWFEDRAPECCLIVYIDDATSTFIDLRFYPSETTQAYMETTKRHIKKYGAPIAYYSDKHSIFKPKKEGDKSTQFGRALETLGIELICAHSPQAKGRVERANQTLQDRLVKELRLRDISTIEEANQFLEAYKEELNMMFAKSPDDDSNAHQSINYSSRELDLILCPRDTRTASKNLELSYKNVKLQLPKHRHRLKGAQITVCELYTGLLVLLHGAEELEYTKFEGSTGPSVETDKSINAKVDEIIKIRKKSNWKPAQDHPWRKPARQTSEVREACV